jgi:hypothetical protein
MENNTTIDPIIITKNTIKYMENIEKKYIEIYQKLRKEISEEIKKNPNIYKNE